MTEDCQMLKTAAYDSWKQVRIDHGLQNDSEIAWFLLQHYEDTLSGFQSAVQCRQCKMPLTLTCPSCSTKQQPLKVEPRLAVASFLTMTSRHHKDVSDGRVGTATMDSKPTFDGSFSSGDNDTDTGSTAGNLADKERNAGRSVVDKQGSTGSCENTVTFSDMENSSFCVEATQGEAPLTIKLRKIGNAVAMGATAERKTQETLAPAPSLKCRRGRPRTGPQLKQQQNFTPHKQKSSPPPSPQRQQQRQHPAAPTQHEKHHQEPKLPTATPQGSRTSSRAQRFQQNGICFEVEGQRQRRRSSERAAVSADQQEDLDRQLVRLVQQSQCGTLDFKRFMRKYKRSYSGACPICKKPVKGLKDHLIAHMPQKPFQCQFCRQSFNNRSTRTYHMLKYHQPDSKRHICDICGASFYKQCLLKVHRRVHTGDKPYVCEQCGSKFSTSAGLINHRTTHAQSMAYTCDQCGKGFHFRCLLKQHMAMHSGVRSFACRLCHKSFFTSKSLKLHEGRHDPVKPHACQVCGRTFNARHQLSRHARLHSEERPFPCNFCGKSFKMKSVLDTHRRLHTGEKPYQCPDCKKAFSDSGNLCKHRRSNHGWTGVMSNYPQT